MTETAHETIQKTETYCSELLTKLPSSLTFHNINHTRKVVDAAREITHNSELSGDEKEVVIVAAWFHDTGFTKTYDGHEEQSAELAANFLQKEGWDGEKISLVKKCILATKQDSEPSSAMEKVIRDADMVHLSQKSYFELLDSLKKELEDQSGKKINDREWQDENLLFLTKHKYYTAYAKENLEPKKLKNIEKQQKILKKLEKKEDALIMSELQIDPQKLKALKKKLSTIDRPERGIETMFRVTGRNHIDLSTMADNKANILISVNSIIISILIGFLTSKLDNNPHLIFPTFFLIGVSVVTIVFSILATRPNVTKGTFTQEDIKNRKANLLFFGNFHSMSREDYQEGMFATMQDSEYLYSSLIDDIYFNGKVLGKKYKFLRIAYNIFMYGIIISVLAFLAVNYHYMATP